MLLVELFLDKFNVLKGSAQDVDAHANLLFCLNYHPEKSAEEIHAIIKEEDEDF